MKIIELVAGNFYVLKNEEKLFVAQKGGEAIYNLASLRCFQVIQFEKGSKVCRLVVMVPNGHVCTRFFISPDQYIDYPFIELK